MTKAKTGWLLLTILCLASFAVAQDTLWQTYMQATSRAYAHGQYPAAEKWLLAALREAEKFGEQDPRLARTLNALGEVYRTQGKYAEAEPLYLRAIAIAEKALGPEHPPATSLNNPEHPLATSLNNLALLYGAQGKYAEAEPLYRRALAIREKALGAEHPDVAIAFNNLATLYRAQGKYAQAEPLYRRSLAIKEKALGPEHPSVATTLENYAALLRKMNRDDEADKLEARAKAIRAKHAAQNPKK